ncbi:hypothetical protein SAMN05216474_3136 [Lishizhenia tianjinensis]|uniref:Uncharacterized protein n=1 Tax=Lishizhenia tianjinensis TaxID=477690 RepID=A0A1I7BW90_9FLAO|nr:hypothetical protein SAMN05216474_3136 [Lishizhenia tianjinensis]
MVKQETPLDSLRWLKDSLNLRTYLTHLHNEDGVAFEDLTLPKVDYYIVQDCNAFMYGFQKRNEKAIAEYFEGKTVLRIYINKDMIATEAKSYPKELFDFDVDTLSKSEMRKASIEYK